MTYSVIDSCLGNDCFFRLDHEYVSTHLVVGNFGAPKQLKVTTRDKQCKA